jgi:hypothetical protein
VAVSSTGPVSSKTLIDKIMTNNPTITAKESRTPTQPSTIAAGPTWPFTVPYDKLWAIVAPAELAICCQKTDTNIKIELMEIIARAIWDNGRDGKGLASRSLPDSV